MTTKTNNGRSRICGIGGSTIAALLTDEYGNSLSPYASAYDVWLAIRGESVEQSSPVLSRGNDMEDLVAAIFEQSHNEYSVDDPKFANENSISCEKMTDNQTWKSIIFQNGYSDFESNYSVLSGRFCDKQHPYLIASPDRLLSGEGDFGFRPLAGLEIKTCGLSQADKFGYENDEIPLHYWTQCQWYMGIIGLPKWYLAVAFVFDGTKKMQSYREYEIDFDEEAFSAMKDVAIKFWKEHVQTGVPPEMTTLSEASLSFFRNKFPAEIQGKMVAQTPENTALTEDFISAKNDFDAAKKRYDDAKGRMIAVFGDCEKTAGDFGSITYKKVSDRSTVDWEAVAKHFSPGQEIIDANTKIVLGFRRFNFNFNFNKGEKNERNQIEL